MTNPTHANQNHGAGLKPLALDACRLIPPLWPLKAFVAVNPMLGLTGKTFEEGASILADRSGAHLLMDRDYYRNAFEEGAYTHEHLQAALERLDLGEQAPDAILHALTRSAPPPALPVETATDVTSRVTGQDWSSFTTDQISFWAASHFDQGEAKMPSPWKTLPPFAAWRAHASEDRTPEIMGLAGFRHNVRLLSDDPLTVLSQVKEKLGLNDAALPAYFHRLLSTIAGWAGHLRYLGWTDELDGGAPEGVIDLLAVRAAYDMLVVDALQSDALRRAWADASDAFTALPRHQVDQPSLVAQTAFELALQERLMDEVQPDEPKADDWRPAAQAVFCIDVRSERYRRALEATNRDIETFGFAGFFGFPIKLMRFGEDQGIDQCPVLLKPGFTIDEKAAGGSTSDALVQKAKDDARRGAWKRFKHAAVSSFAFVEAWGVGFVGALVRDSAKTRSDSTPALHDLEVTACHGDHDGEHNHGMTVDERVATAEGALAGMSMNGPLARLVLLAGHGSSTANNPYAAGLDCGACGGQSGEANALVAAKVLNDPEVREKLAERGAFKLPEDTVFLAGLHNTTTDEMTIYNKDTVPASHQQDLQALTDDLAEAGRVCRRERAGTLGITPNTDVDQSVHTKAQDWSEVRPEWGLAGCASFIAAPRARTANIDLGGRAFLHSYDWHTDDENGILELIMTAPLVVASWINLQYYGSTVDNEAFGSGDKTLHNVVGGFGILEGVGGDLRSGLPMQSVHDGQRPVHEPMRLCAMIEAPIERINAVLEKHDHVRELFDNRWLNLVAILDEGSSFARYEGDLHWQDLASKDQSADLRAAE